MGLPVWDCPQILKRLSTDYFFNERNKEKEFDHRLHRFTKINPYERN